MDKQQIEKAFLAKKIKGVKDLSMIGFALIAQEVGDEKALTEMVEELHKTKFIPKNKEMIMKKYIHEYIKRGRKILKGE